MIFKFFKLILSDTRPFVDRVLKGEKPSKTSVQKQAANNKTGGGPNNNAKNATNNAKNKLNDTSSKKTRDGSTSRKNSLTGSQGSSNSREHSRSRDPSRGNSKSPAKKVLTRQTSKEEQQKQNGETEIANGDAQGTGCLINEWTF